MDDEFEGIDNKKVQHQNAPMIFEKWIRNNAQAIQTELEDSQKRLSLIEKVASDAKKDRSSFMVELLRSLSHERLGNDLKATDSLRKYFDYNMRQKNTRANPETGMIEFISWAVKVHKPELNLAATHIRMG